MNSLPLSNSYEVLRIDENDFVENENHDTTHSLNTLPLSLFMKTFGRKGGLRQNWGRWLVFLVSGDSS